MGPTTIGGKRALTRRIAHILATCDGPLSEPEGAVGRSALPLAVWSELASSGSVGRRVDSLSLSFLDFGLAIKYLYQVPGTVGVESSIKQHRTQLRTGAVLHSSGINPTDGHAANNSLEGSTVRTDSADERGRATRLNTTRVSYM